MKIKIESVVDHGTLNSERVMISVIQSTDLGHFIVADTTYMDDSHISNKLRHMHWFISRSVKAGDKVELYTKKGVDSTQNIGNGNTKYIIYWGLGNSIWNNDGDAAILFHLDDWETTKVKKAR